MLQEAPPAPAPVPKPGPRVAVVHEWVDARAGSEQVFEALAGLWPDADLYALTHRPGVALELAGRPVRTTRLDTDRLRDRRGLTLPLMPAAWRGLGTGTYDLVVTSHHAFAASNRLAGSGTHLAYVHSPARYVWTPEVDGRGGSRLLGPARRALAAVDRRSAARLTGIAANSAEVAARIATFWDREATVIHPPVDTEYFGDQRSVEPTLDVPDGFLLGLGRWIPYKNHDLVLDVAERLGRPVVLAGAGPLGPQLRRRAEASRVPALVLEAPSREQVRELFRRAAVLLFPTREDFGIVPVEAMAAGTPVVAYARGGATETVRDGVSGALVDEHRVEAYAEAVERACACRPMDCAVQAARFSQEQFRRRVSAWAAAHQRVGG